ncbi:MAG: RnfABCDGE type electron transport complex subunit D [Gammaproteobacteria bacterium]
MAVTTEKSLTSPHTHTTRTVRDVMLQVMLALIPGIAVSTWYFGISILANLFLGVLFAVAIEAGLLRLTRSPVLPGITDGTAIVTGMLFALALSPFTVWWVTLTGIAFAILVAKHLFGGVGNNPFNPAMAGYVFVLLCFPVQMAAWPDLLASSDLSFADSLGIIFQGLPATTDGLTGATPLTNMQLELNRMTMVSEIEAGPLYGALGGMAWQGIAIAYLLGGIWLMINHIIRWQIPCAVIGTVLLAAIVCHMTDPDIYPSASYHLFTGGTMLCAFFIATDPASSSTTPGGKIIYGVGIGLLIFIIRTWGSYPDGIGFAVLIMNAFVPLIDYYTRPRVLGET